MQKDTIYIDVEDDITAIIGKIKGSKEKIVALVPPKRIGVLQSAVNLRLLARTAKNAEKRLVIISGNSALASLAGSAGIPVARTLQSKPELVTPSSKDDGEDLIDGADVPIGDHAGLPDDADDEEVIEGEPVPTKIAGIDIDGERTPIRKAAANRDKSDKKSRVKVPDFGVFRKRMSLFIAGGVFLLAFLIWAIWFAPHATVVVTTRTSDVEIQTPITVGPDVELDTVDKAIPAVVQTETQEDTTEFKATGKKDVGEKASGTVRFSNCETLNSVTIQAGRVITAGGKNYVVQSTVQVPGGTPGPFFGCASPGISGAVKVLAEDVGSDYNTGSNVEFAVAGYGDDFTASSSDGITGGSSKTITVVSAQDIQKAREELSKDNSEEIKKKLIDKFDDDVVIIEESFKAKVGNQDLEPGIDEEVTGGMATLTIKMEYTMMGIVESQLDEFLESAVAEQLGDMEGKRVYESGAKTAEFSNFEQSGKKSTVLLSATGKVGPKIDDQKIKDIVKGKRYGEIEEELKSVDGVSDVEVNLFPFWVFNVPNDDNKITIEFKLEDDN